VSFCLLSSSFAADSARRPGLLNEAGGRVLSWHSSLIEQDRGVCARANPVSSHNEHRTFCSHRKCY
jgi:hypothetical protein